MSRVRVLDKHEVVRLLPVADCIERWLRCSRRSRAARSRTRCGRSCARGSGNFMALMPAYRGPPPLYALKTACVTRATLRAPRHPSGFIALFDGVTGETRALLNAGTVTGIRRPPCRRSRPACSAARLGARSRSSARHQALHLEAMRRWRPSSGLLAWSGTPGHAAELDGVEEVGSAREAVRDADVVVTATASPTPILARDWLKEGAHVNAVARPRQPHASSTPRR